MFHQSPLKHGPDSLEDVILQVETLAQSIQSYFGQIVNLNEIKVDLPASTTMRSSHLSEEQVKGRSCLARFIRGAGHRGLVLTGGRRGGLLVGIEELSSDCGRLEPLAWLAQWRLEEVSSLEVRDRRLPGVEREAQW